VEGEVGDGVAEDGLLDEEDVAARGADGLAHLEDVLALGVEHPVHGAVLRDHHGVLHVRLGGGEAELDEADLGADDAAGRRGDVGGALGEDEALDDLRVLHGAAERLDDLDVVEVDVVGHGGVEHAHHGLDGEGGEDVRVGGDDLGGEGRGGGLDEGRAVLEVDGDGNGLEHLRGGREGGEKGRALGGGRRVSNGALRAPGAVAHLLGLLRGALERLGDVGRVDALLEEELALVEQAAAQHDDRGGPVPGLDILGLGELHKHARSGMEHLRGRGTASVERARPGPSRGRPLPQPLLTCMWDMMVAPSLVMRTSPSLVSIILSMPLGPRLVRMASATAAGNRQFESGRGVERNAFFVRPMAQRAPTQGWAPPKRGTARTVRQGAAAL